MPIVLVFLALVVVSLLSFPSAGGARSEPVHLLTSVLTPDVADGYSISERSGVITAAAPTQNVGSNLRVLFWSSDAPVGTEGLSCSTWATATSPQVQQGAALRIGDEGGRVRAVVVTKNVALDAYWVFNVHVWDSITNELRPVGSVDLTGAFAVAGDPEVPRPLPWRMCARTEGPAVRLKVWLRSEPEPAWDDPTHAGVVALPADAPTDGVSGWYVGHLHPGMRATFTELARRRSRRPASRRDGSTRPVRSIGSCPMSFQALYRKYRPQRFGELVGQDHITSALRTAVREQRVGHAYLFSGPRGNGKTTTARILAKALNCLDLGVDGEPCGQCENCVAIAAGTFPDLIEMDAASNRGVDDARDLYSESTSGWVLRRSARCTSSTRCTC